jgi:hypothetical protein
MNHLKRLAIIAMIFCPPIGIAGWIVGRYNLKWSYYLYILSLYIFSVLLAVMGFVTYWMGGNLVKAMGSFF